MSTEVARLIAVVGADISEAERKLPRVDTMLDRLIGTGRKVGKGFIDHLTIPLTDVADTLLDVGGKAVSVATGYEDAMNLLQATSGATAGQMTSLKRTAKDLGADLQLPATSAGDAGQAMLELNKAGLSVDDTLQAARGTLQLSAAANIDNAKAAEINADALNSFHLAGSKATMVADLLAAGANASSQEVEQMAQGFGQASAVFAKYQGEAVGSEAAIVDMTTALGLMANAGIKGSDAGTSVKQMLLQLTGPTDKAKGLMGDLAASIGETGDIAYRADGTMRPLKEIIELTARATADMTAEQRNATLTTIFGADASRAAIVLMSAQSDAAKQAGKDWDSMREAVTKQGAAGDVAEARMKGLTGSVQGLQSQVETLLLEGLEPFLPIMADAVRHAAELAGALGDDVGPAAQQAADVVRFLVDFLGDNGIPILSALTAATVAHALAITASELPALQLQIAALGKSALAAGAAAAPYALLAAAVFGVVKAYQDFNAKVEDGAQQLLETRKWWNDATDAIKEYGDASKDTQGALAGENAALATQREHLKQSLEEYARWKLAGQDQGTLDRKLAAINAEADALEQSTSDFRNHMAVLEAGTPGYITYTSNVRRAADGTSELGRAARLSADDMKELYKKIADAQEEATKAYDDILQTTGDFLGQLEDDQRSHADKLAGIASDSADKRADIEQGHSERIAALGEKDGEERATALQQREDKLQELTRQYNDADTDAERTKLKTKIDDVVSHYNERLAKQDEAASTAISKEKARYDDELATQAKAESDKRDAEAKAYAERERQQALAYAQEQAAQLQHLGQMLIDYATAQGQLQGVSDDKIKTLTDALRREYGVQQSLADEAFGAMKGSVDSWLTGTETSTSGVIDSLGKTRDATADTQAAIDRLSQQRIDALSKQWEDGKISAQEYAKAVADVPARVRTEVELAAVGDLADMIGRVVGDGSAGFPTSGSRAAGGRMGRGNAYLVGEHGPEIVALGGDAQAIPLGGNGGGGAPTVVNVNVIVEGSVQAERDLADTIREQFIDWLRKNNNLLFGQTPG